MRNKYSKEFEEDMKKLAPTTEFNELLNLAKNIYGYSVSKEQLRQYLYKRQIRYKDYNKNKAKDMGRKIPIGTEYVKPDGMTLVKIAKDKWQYKQRYIYSKYHNVELNDDDYIIFLDHNRNNFDISNLKKISRRESSILSNQKMFSTNPKVTETGIQVAQLIIKTKDREKEGKI